MEITLLNYIYPEFVLAVVVITELLKKYFTYHPKWTTLIIASVCAAIDITVRLTNDLELNYWFLLISFGIAVLGYDYLIKPIKDRMGVKNNL